MRALVTPTARFLVLAALAMSACESAPIDDRRNDSRLFPARGVIRGTVSYSGPRPCSKDGHVVGAAILLVFDAKNPPPPKGLANTAVNFMALSGDVLFANEPREPGPELYCPKDHGFAETIFASAPFELAPFDGGAYLMQGFFDTTGNFLPTFKFRNLPESGDIAGGYLDTQDAAKHLGDPTYAPSFKVIEVGVAVPGSAGALGIPSYALPSRGFVADNVTVTLAAPLALPRPYFYPQNSDQPDPKNTPVVVMTQDHHVLANPAAPTEVTIRSLQSSFKAVRVNAGVPALELRDATDPAMPFRMQIAPPPKGGLFVWTGAPSIPETVSLPPPRIPMLWPLVVFAKLADDANPQRLIAQGSADLPAIILQGITLDGDDILVTALTPPPMAPGPGTARDHLTVLVRPSVVCFDPRKIDRGGLLVTPYLDGLSADASELPREKALFQESDILAGNTNVRAIKRGCLPTGRYGINLVYPTGQAWTTPNETGSCADSEGDFDSAKNPSSCSGKPRPVLRSQGFRAILQIVPPATDEGKRFCEAEFPVPPECLHNP